MKSEWPGYIKLMNREIIPALGCTEPITVALAAAKCRQLLQGVPERIQIWVTPNLYKNGMGVVVPGTGLTGLPVAAAAGIAGGAPEGGLEVLNTRLSDAGISGKHGLAVGTTLQQQIDSKLLGDDLLWEVT